MMVQKQNISILYKGGGQLIQALGNEHNHDLNANENFQWQ